MGSAVLLGMMRREWSERRLVGMLDTLRRMERAFIGRGLNISNTAPIMDLKRR